MNLTRSKWHRTLRHLAHTRDGVYLWHKAPFARGVPHRASSFSVQTESEKPRCDCVAREVTAFQHTDGVHPFAVHSHSIETANSDWPTSGSEQQQQKIATERWWSVKKVKVRESFGAAPVLRRCFLTEKDWSMVSLVILWLDLYKSIKYSLNL